MLTVLLAALTALSSVFRDAAASDYVTLRGLLEAGLVLPDARDSDGETLLMRMSSRAQPPLVQLLLEHGADVSLTDEKGCSALMCAALRLASDLRLNWRSRVTADTLAKAMMAHEANKAAQEVTATLLLFGARLPDEPPPWFRRDQRWRAAWRAMQAAVCAVNSSLAGLPTDALRPGVVTAASHDHVKVLRRLLALLGFRVCRGGMSREQGDALLMVARNHAMVGASEVLLEYGAGANASGPAPPTELAADESLTMQIAEEVHSTFDHNTGAAPCALPQVDFALFVLLMLVGRVGGWHWARGTRRGTRRPPKED